MFPQFPRVQGASLERRPFGAKAPNDESAEKTFGWFLGGYAIRHQAESSLPSRFLPHRLSQTSSNATNTNNPTGAMSQGRNRMSLLR
jgi:hypothetical protein